MLPVLVGLQTWRENGLKCKVCSPFPCNMARSNSFVQRYLNLSLQLHVASKSFFADKLSPLVLAAQPKLLSVNMSNNLISEIQPGAFANMTRLVRLILSKNKLTKLESGSLSGTPLRLTQGMINFHRMFNISGVSSLVELELSNNFLESIPIAALSSLKNLKFLNLGSNKIKVKSLIHSMAILYVSI